MILALVAIAAPALQLTLTTDKATVPIGTIPNIELTVTNASKQSVLLVRKLDGSEDLMRFPHIYPEIRTTKGWATVRVGRCGNTNNLELGDFFLLEPGKKWSPGGFFWGRFPEFQKPGVLTLRVVMDTTNSDYERWRGLMGPIDPQVETQLKEKLAKVARVKVVSNPVEIRVIPAPL